MNRLSRRAFLIQSMLTPAMLGTAGGTSLARDAEGNAQAENKTEFTFDETTALEALAADFMSKFSVPGLSVAIAAGERLVYQRGFGFADVQNREEVTPDHLFRIASVSKPITAVTLFRWLEAHQGVVNGIKLTDKVFGTEGILGNEYGYPPYRKWVEDIRLEHLLTHTSGGWPNNGKDPMFQHPEMDQRQLVAWTIANMPVTQQPGTKFAYSNFGYCVLGRVIEKVTGKPYADAVKEITLKPCGIERMQIAGNTREQRLRGEVIYYGSGGEDPYSMPVTRMDSHGGWVATPTDLVRLLVRVDGLPKKRDILSPETLRTMYAAPTASPNYAHGWMANAVPNYWHNGSLPGTTTLMVRTASGMCWAALTNTRQSNPAIAQELDRLMWNMVSKIKTWPTTDLFGK